MIPFNDSPPLSDTHDFPPTLHFSGFGLATESTVVLMVRQHVVSWLRMAVRLHAEIPLLLAVVFVFSTVMLGIEASRAHGTYVAHHQILDALLAGEAAVELSTLAAEGSVADFNRILDSRLRRMRYAGRGTPSAERALTFARATVSTDLAAATEALGAFVFLTASDAFAKDKGNAHAPLFLSSSVGIQAYTNARSGWDLLHIGELDGWTARHPNQNGPSTLRLHMALAMDIMCAPWFAGFRQFLESGSADSFCFSSVADQVRGAIDRNPLGIDMNLVPPSCESELSSYARSLLESYRSMMERLRVGHEAFDYSRGRRERIGILCAVIAISFVGVLLSLLLIRKQRIFIREQADIESEFQCGGQGVKIKTTALRSLREVSGKLAILQPNVDAYGPVSNHQMSLSIRRAAEPLSMLRPFVPKFMFTPSGVTSHVEGLEARILRNSTLLSELKETMPSGVKGLLNLTPTVNSAPDAMYLLVSLASFGRGAGTLEDEVLPPRTPVRAFSPRDTDPLISEDDGPSPVQSDTDAGERSAMDPSHVTGAAYRLCRMLHLVTFYAAHFGGAVVQVSHDCIVAQFIRPEDNDEGDADDDGDATRWEDNACRCAFAIQNLCSRDPVPLPSRMALVSGRAVFGSTQFHVSRMYTLLSPALLLGLRLLPLAELHNCDILTEPSVVCRLPECFLTRPIHILYPLDVTVRNGGPCEPITVHQVVLEEPDPTDSNFTPEHLEEIRREQTSVKEFVKGWESVWVDYEKVVRDPKPSASAIEYLYTQLTQFRLFRITQRDVAFEMALSIVRQIAADNNVSISAAIDDE